MVTIGTVIERVARTLIDENFVGWTQDELYDYYNMAAAAIVTAVPTSHTVVGPIPLVAGALQELPADGLSLMSIFYNAASKQAVNQVGLELQNQAARGWVGYTPETDVVEYMTDVRMPRRFFVNPPNDGNGSVVALYSAVPAQVEPADEDDPIPFTDIYQNPLWAATLAFAYAKNSKRQDVAKSQFYLQMANQMLGLREQSKIAVAPKLDNAEPT